MVKKASNIKIEVKVTAGSKVKTYQLNQTAKAVKSKSGHMTKAVFQPAPENDVLMPYGKIYVDTSKL